MIAQIEKTEERGSGRKMPDTWDCDGFTYMLIQQYLDRLVWDCSIQKPFRRFLGQIEYNQAQGTWAVINVERQPWSSRDVFCTWNDALLCLHELVNERQKRERVAALR